MKGDESCPTPSSLHIPHILTRSRAPDIGGCDMLQDPRPNDRDMYLAVYVQGEYASSEDEGVVV